MQRWFSQKSQREAKFAGQFYPENKLKLKELLNQYLQTANKLKGKDNFEQAPNALIVPHAGYIFSGKVAASAYATISSTANYKKVFVIASSHRYSFNGAAVYKSGNYATPLGSLNVDTAIASELLNHSSLFVEHDDAHDEEHSIEVQLPFLQNIFGNNISLVPIILGTHNPETCKKIAESLKKWFIPENLFVISTDFSHYPDYENAIRVDKATCKAICTNKPNKLLTVLNENKKENIPNLATSLCGWTSVLTLLYLTEGKNYSYNKRIYLNSGDSSLYNDKKKVVGYWAIAVYDNDHSFHITEEEKKEILEKARTSIETYIKTGKKNDLIPPLTNGILNKKMGAFVSIYVDGKLRGCIGGFAQEKSLNELIQKTAVSATRDHRFESIQKKELKNIELEISVLSPLKKIKSADEIVLGKHGIYIEDKDSSGTFLPQVAIKTGWDLEQFLGHCSRDKAGLGWDGWKTAELFTYEAIIFRG